MGAMSEINRGSAALRNAVTANARPELSDPSVKNRLVGLGFRVVEQVFLLEIGDEYLDVKGEFRSVPLEFVGRPAPEGTLVRRFERPLR